MFTFSFIILSVFTTIIATVFFVKNKKLSKILKIMKETEEIKQSFLATLIHDLKTPTNAQLNTIKLLKNGAFGKLTSEQHEMLSLTQESCNYMSDLIATIMDTYKFDAGKINLHKTKFEIYELLEDICKNLKGLSHQIVLNPSIPCFIYADKLQIKRVITNFLSNAITYSFPNSKIEINTNFTQKDIEISVKNISKPIPKEELKTIFNKFQRTKYSHFNKASTGLGLYLAKQIIELHNGEIYAKSDDNGICIFGFKLPTEISLKTNDEAITKVQSA